MSARRVLLAVAAALLLAAPAAGKTPPSGWGKAKPRAGAPSDKKLAERARLVAEGDEFLAQARRAWGYSGVGSREATTAATQAIARYDQALAISRDADVIGRAIVAVEYLDQSDRRWRLYIHYVDLLREVAPRDPRDTDLIPELCTALAKLAARGGPEADALYARAVDEYDRWRQRIDDTDPRYFRLISTFSTNAAELIMALGPDHLERAIEYYETGIQFDPSESLGYYGAAVAYDRDGQWTKAQEMMREALRADGLLRPSPDDRRAVHGMGRLAHEDVYFVPDGDVAYYYALGYHVQGAKAEALLWYRRFLKDLPSSPFAGRAREHIAELEAELGQGAR